MRKILILLFIGITISAFSQDYNYLVKCKGKLVEERHYLNDTLKSIIAYNCTDTKDSITYDGQNIVWYHYRKDDFELDNLYPFHKYYYAYFDKSLQNNHVYNLIKSHCLIEDVLWSLADIDNSISSDSTLLSPKRTIIQNGTECCIIYKIDSRCMLHQLFEIYKDESLNIKGTGNHRDSCLMPNHVHLLLGEKRWKVGDVMKSIASSYVFYYNKKYGRVGHLEKQ